LDDLILPDFRTHSKSINQDGHIDKWNRIEPRNRHGPLFLPEVSTLLSRGTNPLYKEWIFICKK
jgi:hypothetical protein